MRVSTLAVLLALAATGAARAEDGFYASLHAGASLPSDSDVDAPGLSGTSEFETGFLVGGSVGYAFEPFRVETELSYRQSDVDELDLGGGLALPGAGDVGALTGMVNAFYDVDLTPLGLAKLSPYVGGGLGFANLNVDTDDSALLRVDDSDTVFAWNLQAGAAYALTEHVDLGIGYRYLSTDDASFDADAGAFGSGELDVDGYDTHEVLASLRYRF